MDPLREVRKLLSHRDTGHRAFWIIALAIALFWLVTASHLWG
jgi:hypothetical protein